MPRGTNAPKLWPAEPVNVMSIVSSGRPVAAVAAWSAREPSIVPTVRLTLRIGSSMRDRRRRRSSAGRAQLR